MRSNFFFKAQLAGVFSRVFGWWRSFHEFSAELLVVIVRESCAKPLRMDFCAA
jgi:hypothetical protein